MDRRQKILVTVVAALAVTGIGTGAVLATGGDNDQTLQGDPRAKATAAALDYVGGGRDIETEVGDDAAYGVEILRPDGSVVEVNLDESLRVIGSEGDDDTAGETEGPNDD